MLEKKATKITKVQGAQVRNTPFLLDIRLYAKSNLFLQRKYFNRNMLFIALHEYNFKIHLRLMFLISFLTSFLWTMIYD